MKHKTSEGVLPSLLWRIDEAEQLRGSNIGSISTYKADVLRNLKWILNAVARPMNDGIYHFPKAADSTLNFGLPPSTGRLGSSVDIGDYSDMIKKAILRFETRIMENTLEVKGVEENYNGEVGYISYVISGSIWCEPLPERFSIETKVNAESGDWSF